jgi:hypothetical protein
MPNKTLDQVPSFSESKGISEAEFMQVRSELVTHGALSFTLVGDSMLPLLKPGLQLTVKPLTAPFRLFDIIVFWNGRVLICHYIKHFNYLGAQTSLVASGLNTPGEDLPVLYSHVLGIIEGYKISWFRRLCLRFSH